MGDMAVKGRKAKEGEGRKKAKANGKRQKAKGKREVCFAIFFWEVRWYHSSFCLKAGMPGVSL